MRRNHAYARSTAAASRNYLICTIVLLSLAFDSRVYGQTSPSEAMAQQLQRLLESMDKTEAQLAASQQQIIALRLEVEALKHQLAEENAGGASSTVSAKPALPSSEDQLAKTVEDLSERQAVLQSEVATHEQSKVESQSKYPVKITGLILLNGFTTSRMVDTPATPTFASPGTGSSGATLRQTILGIDARGPHLSGALSSADLRVDFAGTSASNAYNNAVGILRLRTAHAALNWESTELFFALDRPILNPNAPSSLTAVAEPALAWSGNLWNWNPQLGIQHDVGIAQSYRMRVQAALIDAGDPPGAATSGTQPVLSTPSGSERSRWPGLETRIALQAAEGQRGAAFGIGGYFSPHRTPYGTSYDAWAATIDYRLPLPARMQWSGSAYRGLALGGLGGGTFKDDVSVFDPGSQYAYTRPLDDIGGWTQLKQTVSERFEWNAAYGIDSVFAGQLRPFALTTYAPYQNLARNRTFFSNVIYSPSAYLLFSVEYRRLQSSPINAPTTSSNIFGLAAAYKF